MKTPIDEKRGMTLPNWFPGTMICTTVLLLSLVSACAGPVDRSLSTDAPCQAPCWQGLIPGESNEDDAWRVLTNSPFVRLDTLELEVMTVNDRNLTEYAWRDYGRGEQYNRLYLQGGKILFIELDVDYRLTLGEVISRFGPPEGVYAFAMMKEYLNYSVVFDYPSRGLEFTSFSHPKGIASFQEGYGVITEGLQVTDVRYYAPTSLADALRNVFLYSDEAVSAMLRDEQEWLGFGQRVRLAQLDRW